MKKKANVITTVTLHDAPNWTHEEEFVYEEDGELTAFCMAQSLKIQASGGILDFLGPFEMNKIPIWQIKNINVKAVEQGIVLDTNVQSAIEEFSNRRKAEELMRNPNRQVM